MSKHKVMKAYDVADVKIQEFLKSALDAGEWSDLCSGCFTPEDRIADFH
jgi:hypothetical protein